MNERIRELAEQCYEKHELLGTYEFNKEKFAESIVEECLFKIRVKASQYLDPEWRDGLIDDIEQHFGVKN